MTEQVPEPVKAEATETTEEPIANSESTTKVEGQLLDSDAFVNRVADAVFGRMQAFTNSLVESAKTAEQIAANMVPVDQAPPVEGGAPAAPAQEPPPDTQPTRRHSMFKQPFNKQQ